MLTQERLKEVTQYNPDTGEFVWLKTLSSKGVKGSTVGSKSKRGTKTYRETGIDGKRYYLHRLVFLYMTGEMPEEVDHINGDGEDNRWENLRAASRLANQKNMRKSTRNTSGAVGVHWHNQRSKWAASIRANGVSHHLGLFTEFDDAVKARKDAEALYDFHPNHGKDRPL